MEYRIIAKLHQKMNSQNKQKKESVNKSVGPLKGMDCCDVSQASVEIMLERFYNGKDIDFPFSR